MKIGIIYAATGNQTYLEEASDSARSCKKAMPDVPITLFCDQVVRSDSFDNCSVISKSQSGYIDKIRSMLASPYERTLFLDTDTYVIAPIDELFTILSKYEIGFVLAEHRSGKYCGAKWDYQTFFDNNGNWMYPIANTGVILYRRCEKVDRFLSTWLELATREYHQWRETNSGIWDDQDSFCQTLHQSELRDVVLPPEYNCRFIYPSGVCGRVKVLHGRSANIQQIATEINKSDEPRVWYPGIGLISSSRLSLLRQSILNAFPRRIFRLLPGLKPVA